MLWTDGTTPERLRLHANLAEVPEAFIVWITKMSPAGWEGHGYDQTLLQSEGFRPKLK